ncbi:ArsR/SmtB family transcription factor [Halobacterium wangiae]|uniref:ArsR/SmtB family transcription factor n=1 Tax=Halobacterium wangiae TaxID=2902623 RepID=UPI001E52587B|nr:hypothetical protein [Halobacterium wangiae]
MEEANDYDGVREESGLSPVPAEVDALAFDERPDEGAASEAFQALASEVRVAVLVQLARAEHDSSGPQSFAEIQELVGSDSSARFAYHLRQLDGQFVQKTPEGYVLTPAGRRAAAAVLAGTFTDDGDRRAS